MQFIPERNLLEKVRLKWQEEGVITSRKNIPESQQSKVKRPEAGRHSAWQTA